jgi:hypothetical protein
MFGRLIREQKSLQDLRYVTFNWTSHAEFKERSR